MLAKSRYKIRATQAERNVDEVAKEIAAQVNGWMAGRRFPEDFGREFELREITFSSGPLVVQTETILASTHLEIATDRGDVLYRADVDASEAELILRALQFGRRSFSIPITTDGCEHVIGTLPGLVESLQLEIDRLVELSGVGLLRFESEVRSKVVRRVAPDAFDLRKLFAGESRWAISKQP